MIVELLKALKSQPFYNVSERVEIAKGKNEIGHSFRKIKRAWLLKKK